MAGSLFDLRRDGQARAGLQRASPSPAGVASKSPQSILSVESLAPLIHV